MGKKWVKMGKEVIMFGDVEIKKHEFHLYKNPIF